MSLNTITRMAADGDLQQRFVACAAQEQIPNPDAWVYSNKWSLVIDSDAVAAYESAMLNDTDDIGGYGKNSAVVTDGKILSVVQTLWASQQPPPE